jgi:hypothetical protein
MTMSEDPVDAMGPWTIKSVPTSTKEAVIKAARQEGCTVGQWLERRVGQWLADGSPIPVDAPPANLEGLGMFMREAREYAVLAGLPMSKTLARAGLATVREHLKRVRIPKSQKALPPPGPEGT